MRAPDISARLPRAVGRAARELLRIRTRGGQLPLPAVGAAAAAGVGAAALGGLRGNVVAGADAVPHGFLQAGGPRAGEPLGVRPTPASSQSVDTRASYSPLRSLLSVARVQHRAPQPQEEFFLMLCALAASNGLALFLDVVIIVVDIAQSDGGVGGPCVHLFVLIHAAYAAVVCYFGGHILKLHLGFIGRSELSSDWKEDTFYRVSGKTVWRENPDAEPVFIEDLDRERSEELINALVVNLDPEDYNKIDLPTTLYDPSRNEFDKGFKTNWWNFFCVPRWRRGCTGEF
ncbi:unnamed protein product [Prorocentrum cordatum]|uniref:Protein S-acyltransferase n=1 Tax=Prorocentrum cordatum TaxID=2364126 RepID=A0ABN9RTG3_9DINO|nr:unnamed protein product [Polarella glacialis]